MTTERDLTPEPAPRASGAAERVQRYIEERRKMRGIDQHSIHGVNAGCDNAAELTTSDLMELIDLAQPKHGLSGSQREQQVGDLLKAISAAYSAYGWIPDKDFNCLFEEVARLAGIVEEGWDASLNPEETQTEARAVLARWGHRPPQPLAMSNRRPGFRDDAETACPFDSFHEPAESAGWWSAIDWVDKSFHQPPEPIALSDRLPGPEDCDVEGRCWFGTPLSHLQESYWVYRKRECCRDWNTQWLPHYALPLPCSVG